MLPESVQSIKPHVLNPRQYSRSWTRLGDLQKHAKHIHSLTSSKEAKNFKSHAIIGCSCLLSGAGTYGILLRRHLSASVLKITLIQSPFMPRTTAALKLLPWNLNAGRCRVCIQVHKHTALLSEYRGNTCLKPTHFCFKAQRCKQNTKYITLGSLLGNYLMRFTKCHVSLINRIYIGRSRLTYIHINHFSLYNTYNTCIFVGQYRQYI